MLSVLRKFCAAAAACSMVTATGVIAPAWSAEAEVSCGTVVTKSTVLQHDVGPCTGPGLVVAADDVTLDLNGHRVFGLHGVPGEGAGVLIDQRRGVQVKNGTVSDFDGGVAILGGGGNKVSGITARDNVGLWGLTAYGDGIAILSSTDNLVVNSTAERNGPYSGVGLYQRVDGDHPRSVEGETTRNTINGNVVRDNNTPRSPAVNDNDGIRLEPDVHGNAVVNNTVSGSGLDGIALFAFAANNVIDHNVVTANGFHSARHRKGDGIRVFRGADRTVVHANRSFGNAANGIILSLNAKSNQVVDNKTGTNAAATGPAPAYDLHDANVVPPCDANVWLDNTYGSFNQPCVTASSSTTTSG